MRVAWFSPLPPAGSGIAAYSAELLPLLGEDCTVDCFVASGTASLGRIGVAPAHDFVWRNRREPYDLTVYQLGNAAWHDYMWAYLANYPGLVVLHDARLHHARARQLLRDRRFDDYRNEFRFDHPDAAGGVAEYAVEGLGGTVYYLWRMVAAVIRTARGVAVHNRTVAADLEREFPDTRIDTIRMGVPAIAAAGADRGRVRRALGIPPEAVVFGAFGKVTPEKRIAAALRALKGIRESGAPAHLLLIGDTSGYPELAREIASAGAADAVSIAGSVPDVDLPAFLAAADACLCLRWPTADETSASWLRCLAGARPTVISDLPHLTEVPTLLARGWRRSHPNRHPVAIAVDVLDEDATVRDAMQRLATDPKLRAEIGSAGHAFWNAEHRLELMADDYKRLLPEVAQRPVPTVPNLPSHFTDDYSSRAREIAQEFGVDVDILRRR